MSFAEFVQFVKEESDLANDPVLSPDILKRERKGLETTKDYRGKGQNKADSFAISTIQEQFPLCKGTHPLTKCREFKKKRVEERREFVKTKDLCFGCLKSGHLPAAVDSGLPVKSVANLTQLSFTTPFKPLSVPKEIVNKGILTLKPRTSRSPPHMLPLLQATSQRARTIVCVAQQVYLTLGPPPL